MSTRLRVLAICAAGGPALCGCGGSGPREGVSIADREARPKDRIAAIGTAREDASGDPAVTRATYDELKKTVWLIGNPDDVRIAAVRELVEFDEFLDETRKMFRLRTPTEPSSEVVQAIVDEAASRGWTDLAPALVRRWVMAKRAAPTDLTDVEPRGLVALFPGRDLASVVFEVFTGSLGAEAPEERDRLAAWDLLNRLDPTGARTLELLGAHAASTDPLIALLQRAGRELRVTARTGEELAWLQRLGDAGHAAFWGDAREAIAGFDDHRRYGLELRHIPVVVFAWRHDRELLGLTDAELDSRIEGLIGGKHAMQRAAKQESLHAWRDVLTWPDRVAVAVAARAAADDAVRAAVFALADTDRNDTSTEHGGLIVADSAGKLVVQHFAPRANERFSDTRFVASRDMINQGDEALFHFHMHAHKHNNSDYAGPSGEDIANARRLGRCSLVLTFTGEDRLNADYYQGNDVVIDLGTLARPSAGGR